MDTKTKKVTVDQPIQVNDKVYFAGEIEVAEREADAVKMAVAERQRVQEEYGADAAPMTKEAAGPAATGGTQTSGGKKSGKSEGSEDE